ncbi:ABC transporter ATP-binding protein [Halobacteriales archaeon QS_1_68_20]|nr:MAG: ABC transporter ATP-binding protein [Halobacteriales archaeon QS_1_68_20]
MPLLEFEDLSIRYRTDGPDVKASEDVNFEVDYGKTFGLVGESGCGKTTLGKSILQLLDDNGYVESGHIWYDDVLPEWKTDTGKVRPEVVEDDRYPVRDDGMMDLTALDSDDIRRVRWNNISLIPQSSMNALNPVYRVGDQIVEAIRVHEPETPEDEAHERARDLLEQVGIERERADDYAHQFSGGMKQRAIIAMAMACNPDMVIADEPTTALDVIIQDRVLDAIREMQDQFDVSMLIISHDISVMAETCDRLGVMYGGRLMESGTTKEVIENPANPYTMGLQNSFPTVEESQERLLAIPGTPPTLTEPADECRFAERCPFATNVCMNDHPPMYDAEAASDGRSRVQQEADVGHRSACYRLDVLEEMRERAKEEETWQQTETPSSS